MAPWAATVAAAAALVLGLVVLAIPHAASPEQRARVTRQVVRPRRPKRAYLRTPDSLALYLGTLSRGAKTNLTTNADKAQARFSMTSRLSTVLSLQHFLVILAHERRMYWLPRAVLASVMRWLTASLMDSVIDEYRDEHGRLTAFAQTVVWGNVLRGAWFYQRERAHLWHCAIRLAVQRAMSTPGIEWIDLGPSASNELAAAKAKMGFIDYADWRSMCRYDGPFRHAELLAPR